jgi:hypothetical protein
MKHRILLLIWSLVLYLPGFAAETIRVELMRTPNDGIQPQTVVDSGGVVHLIYFKGEARAGDVFYSKKEPSSSRFSDPIQVNSQPGSAIAVGTIRGAQMALGRNGRVHVIWNGSGAQPAVGHEGVPLWYARLNDVGDRFEPERDLITVAAGLDGGGSIAADSEGHVYAVWHAHVPGAERNEAGRAVFVAGSTDDGKTFASERRATPEPTGACGCCGLKAFADRNGVVSILFRSARDVQNRDEVMLASRDRGETFQIVYRHRWQIQACPMSSAFFAEGKNGMLAAWETAGQVFFTSLGDKDLSGPFAPPGKGKRKHPGLAMNERGETLMVWAEGTGWNKGGALVWQLFDRDGKPKSEHGMRDGIPVWSFASTFAGPDGSFVILY